MSKKTLLNEGTVRRLMKLASIDALNAVGRKPLANYVDGDADGVYTVRAEAGMANLRKAADALFNYDGNAGDGKLPALDGRSIYVGLAHAGAWQMADGSIAAAFGFITAGDASNAGSAANFGWHTRRAGAAVN